MKATDHPTPFYFVDDLAALTAPAARAYLVHLCCIAGELRFTMHGDSYLLTPDTYAIIIHPSMLEKLEPSPDFEAHILFLPNNSSTFQIGDVSLNLFTMPYLILHPLLELRPEDRQHCLEELQMLRRRFSLSEHRLHHPMLRALLAVHIFNLHDVIQRTIPQQPMGTRALRLMGAFLAMLQRGDYREHRGLSHYARELFVSEKYLSQVSRETSLHPPTYWIDLYASGEIVYLLREGYLSLTEIADRFSFSSMSYFTRYVRRTTGFTPSELRKRVEATSP